MYDYFGRKDSEITGLATPIIPKAGTPYLYKEIEGLENCENLEKVNLRTKSTSVPEYLANTDNPFFYRSLDVHKDRKQLEVISEEVPIFQDTETKISEILPGEKIPGFVNFDSDIHSLNNCCVQITLSSRTADDCRFTTD